VSHLPTLRRLAGIAVIATVASLSACSWMTMAKPKATLTLSGTQEVPALTIASTGEGTVMISADGAVSGSITVTGFVPTMAHIHMAPAGTVGPVIVPMVKTGEGSFAFADGAKLTAEQLAAYKAGNLYVNVHSAANKGGEVRGQLKP
jgi:hypothetical protein